MCSNQKCIDKLFVDINIISHIKTGQKLSVNGSNIRIEQQDLYTIVKRWWFKESREISINYINEMVDDIDIILETLLECDSKLNTVSRFKDKLEKFLHGISNLSKTYVGDNYIISKLELITERISDKIVIISEYLINKNYVKKNNLVDLIKSPSQNLIIEPEQVDVCNSELNQSQTENYDSDEHKYVKRRKCKS
jgi:hypothetical protein